MAIIPLETEDGEVIDCVILDEVELETGTFLVVIPYDELEDEESDIIILKEMGDDGDEVTYDMASEEEMAAVVEVLRQNLDDYDIEL